MNIVIKLEPLAKGYRDESVDKVSGIIIKTENENWIEISEELFVDESNPQENLWYKDFAILYSNLSSWNIIISF